MSEEASGPGPPQPAVRRLLLWLEPELEPVTHRAGALTVGPRTVRRAPLSRGRPPGSEGRGAGRAGACGSEPGRSPPGAVPPPRSRRLGGVARVPRRRQQVPTHRHVVPSAGCARLAGFDGAFPALRVISWRNVLLTVTPSQASVDFMRADRVDSGSVCLRLWRGERAAESGAHGGGGPAMLSVGNASPQVPLTPSGFELTRGHWIVL